MKILKFFIFWFFDLFERFYINTNDPDLCIARRSGHRSRSTHFILPLKVGLVLSDFPLGRNPQAASCECSADLVRTCWSASEVERRPAGLISAQSRTISDENFCGAEKKSKIFGLKRD